MAENIENPNNEILQSGILIADRFEVVRTLGHGGMGYVILVKDRELDNEFLALKLLYPHLARDRATLGRFRNEVLVARRLSHPNIVRIYDFGHAGRGYHYISMEYVAGGSLSAQIYQMRRANLPFNEVLRMLRDIADGIHHAHHHGIIHRDLKPDNILITDKNEIKVTDFGLARTLFSDHRYTETGETVGTPYYMAPEQLQGEKVDGRGDIYALGIIAYEMVIGRRPFFDESYLKLAAMHIREPLPDFATKESGIPKWFEDFVKQCCAKKPDQRFQTANEIVDFLNGHLGGEQTANSVKKPSTLLSFYTPTKKLKATTERSDKSRRKMIAVAGLMTLVAAIGFLTPIGVIFSKAGLSVESNVEKYTRKIKFSLLGDTTPPDEFFNSIASGIVDDLRMYLDEGYSANSLASGGVTALSLAASTGQIGVLNLLLEKGADINKKGKEDRTALHISINTNQFKSTEVLLNNGAEPNSRDLQGKTPLIEASIQGSESLSKLLINRGSLLDVTDQTGRSPLSYATEGGNLPLVQLLVERGAQLDLGDYTGKTPLAYSVDKKRSEITKYLILKGASLTMKNKLGAIKVETKRNETIQDTRLRKIGELNFNPGQLPAGGAGMKITAEIKNTGESTAKNITIKFITKNSDPIIMIGPDDLKSNQLESYSALVPRYLADTKAELEIKCSNCHD